MTMSCLSKLWPARFVCVYLLFRELSPPPTRAKKLFGQLCSSERMHAVSYCSYSSQLSDFWQRITS